MYRHCFAGLGPPMAARPERERDDVKVGLQNIETL